jgi:4'-phosphopantetheinyl transferase
MTCLESTRALNPSNEEWSILKCGAALQPIVNPETIWSSPPPGLALPETEVHVWRASLDRAVARDDQERAIVSHRALRAILARYLGTAPARLEFDRNPHGKPFLARASGEGEICFSLSRSHGLALYAFAREREVGVDVEQVRPISEVAQALEHVLSARERAEFCALPAEGKEQVFFEAWTRKQAFVKATGYGESLPSSEVEVSMAEPAQLLGVRGDPRETARWQVWGLRPGDAYAAALVVESPPCQLLCWNFDIAAR